MNLAITMYLIGLLSSLSVLSFILIITSILLIVLICIFIDWERKFSYGRNEEDTVSKYKLYIKRLALFALLPSIILFTAIPSKTDMYIMAGLVVGEKIITSEKGNELMDKSYELLVSKIEEATSESSYEK